MVPSRAIKISISLGQFLWSFGTCVRSTYRKMPVAGSGNQFGRVTGRSWPPTAVREFSGRLGQRVLAQLRPLRLPPYPRYGSTVAQQVQ